MNRRDRRIAAKGSGALPAIGSADSPDALHQAGMAYFRAGRPLDAQTCCQQALALDAEHAATLHLMGLLSFHTRQFDHAREWISRAIRKDAQPEYLASLAAVLQEQRQYAEALQVIDKAVQLSPDNAELWRQLGDILVQQKRFDEALLTYQHVLTLDPKNQDAHYKSGVLLGQFARHQEALVHLDRSIELLPKHALTLEARARSLFNMKRLEESLAAARRADQLGPGNADNRNLIGAVLHVLGRDEEALKWFDKALELQLNAVDALNNKILSLHDLHRFDEIFAIYDRMRSLKLNTRMTDWNVCLAHLITGNFEDGWRGHHARFDLPSSTYPKLSLPTWIGEESIEGKTILVAADEGLGDTIQFVRYVPMLAERGARVLLLVQDSLRPLLAGVTGISQCISKSDLATLPAIDFHCAVSSLPLALGTRLDTIPSARYLPEPAESRVQAWNDRLGPRGKLRVGLVWSGNPAHSNDHNRSTSLRTMSRILDVDARFISLQKGPRPTDAAVLAERGDIVDMTADLTDFTETAALISCLDLVISVDTSVVHLAGALGKPTWILLPYTPDYRWLLDRDDSPWYPSARLFRQDKTRDYAKVLDRVRSELQALVAVR